MMNRFTTLRETLFKKTVAALLLLGTSQLFANAESDLSNFFNNLGFDANVTGSHAYQTQAAGYAALGSVYARNQVRTIRLAHVDVPGMRSGCGGIDLFAGGFSFIKSDQIVKFMQNILSGGAGYALNLALETELPEIAHAMQFMQKLANEINGTNFNSCEMGENLSAAVWPRNRAAQQRLCEDLGRHQGTFTDWAMARQKCSTGGDADSILAQAKNNPEYKDRVLINTNIVWDSLQINQFIAQDPKLAEVYMSISGTIVFNVKGALMTYPSLATNQDFIKALLYGGKLPSYHCTDTGPQSHCLSIDATSTQEISAKNALVAQVQELLQGIYDNIKMGKELSDKQKGLIELTQPAVFNLISANAQQNTGIQGSYELAQSVATDLLAQYLSNSLDIIRASLSGKELGAHNEERLYKNLQLAQQFVARFSTESRERFNAALQTNELIRNNVKQALSALTPTLRTAYYGDAQ
ncbi:putative conjugative transfer protein TraH (plasmid) [Legionella longbeachae NSW150]|uniref:Putative conjugative transfer protein TraH n=1 Tax=Legionella longbeachae serogroup 1 (strain NSW150) TaxID=661367 RepID=D3HTT5_LEGLN|nr:conjugal transfer protein TraH [Legionella longbeachae]CBJ13943.1 putative conjugative transfer protein TraH [Legionella longbeachae NSW150]